MTKDFKRRLDELERKVEPAGGFICVLGTPENQALVAAGFLPDDPNTRAKDTSCERKQPRRRLGKGDIVIFMSELELAL